LTIIALYVAFTFFISTTPSFHFVRKNFLETELGEALDDKEIYLKSDRGTQLVNPERHKEGAVGESKFFGHVSIGDFAG
jgi:hypothetical protein